MIFQRYAVLAVILLLSTTLLLLITRRSRLALIILAVQYLAAAWLVATVWPAGLAAVKLIIGWMVAAIMAASDSTGQMDDERISSLSGKLFRLLAVAAVWLVIYSSTPAVAAWLPVDQTVLSGGLVLVMGGLVQLGMTDRPLRVLLGLLTVLSGFEVIYAALEPSILVAGLLAIVNLGLAVTGVYLMAEKTPSNGETS